jgi:DNA polymerase-4
MPKLARFRAKQTPPDAESRAGILAATAASASSATPILHVDMDAFFVSVELLSRPDLLGLPVVVGGRKDQRGVVTSASYEARRFGIHSAMPLRTAGQLCPHAIFLENRPELYGEWSDRIAGILASYSPVVELASVDEAYLDFTGTERLHGPPLVAADQLLRDIRCSTGLPCSGGLASTRLVAKVASEQAKPQGLVWVPPGVEAAFLAPLDVRKIPGIGKVTEGALNALEIHTVGQLAAIPREKLEESFGRWGTALYRKSLGQDSYEFFVDAEAKSISHNQTFGADTNDRAKLETTLSYLMQKATKRLRDSGLYARTISVTIRYANFRTVTRSKSLPEPTDLDGTILAVAKNLFEKNWDGRAMLRLIGISLESLSADTRQLALLDAEQRTKLERLARTADRLRDRFGFSKLQLGGSLSAGTKNKDDKEK